MVSYESRYIWCYLEQHSDQLSDVWIASCFSASTKLDALINFLFSFWNNTHATNIIVWFLVIWNFFWCIRFPELPWVLQFCLVITLSSESAYPSCKVNCLLWFKLPECLDGWTSMCYLGACHIAIYHMKSILWIALIIFVTF